MLSLYQITGLTAIRAGTDMCRDVTIHSRIALLMKLSGLKNRPDRNDPGIVPIRTICIANWRELRDYGP